MLLVVLRQFLTSARIGSSNFDGGHVGEHSEEVDLTQRRIPLHLRVGMNAEAVGLLVDRRQRVVLREDGYDQLVSARANDYDVSEVQS